MGVEPALSKLGEYLNEKDPVANGLSDLLRQKLSPRTRDERVIHEAPHQGLAFSFGPEGDLTTLKGLDDRLKVLIATSMKKMQSIPPNNRSWETVHASFLNNETAQPWGEAQTINSKPFEIEKDSHFKLNGTPNPAIVDRVMHWWNTEAVPDEDIRHDTKVDIQALAKIVARSGAAISHLRDVVSKNQYRSVKCIDVGVLRYPDMKQPYFKLYRIEVFAFADSRRIFWYQTDTNGIYSSLTYRIFQPRDEVINQLRANTIRAAASMIDDLFV